MRRPALILMMLACLVGCGGEQEEKLETTDKVAVGVKAARVGSIRDMLRVTGSVTPAPGAELMVTAPGSARILEMPKAEGDTVRKGDLLVRFEMPAVEAESASKQSDLARATARLETARSAASRLEGLFDRGIAARREVEDARRELAEADAAVSESRTAVQAAAQILKRRTVTAPFAGTVAKRWHNPGDLVEASSGDPILRLIDPSHLEVEVSVPVGDLPRVGTGRPARVIGPGSYPPEKAAVRSGPAGVDPATGTAPVRLTFDRPTSLPAGTLVQVEVYGDEHASAVIVPEEAVVREGQEAFLFTVDGEGRARRCKVEVGIASGGEVEIRDGVHEGEMVIVRGQEALPDGAAVTANPITTNGS